MYSAEAQIFPDWAFVEPNLSSLAFFSGSLFFLFIPCARGFHLFLFYDSRLNLLAGFQNTKYSL